MESFIAIFPGAPGWGLSLANNKRIDTIMIVAVVAKRTANRRFDAWSLADLVRIRYRPGMPGYKACLSRMAQQWTRRFGDVKTVDSQTLLAAYSEDERTRGKKGLELDEAITRFCKKRGDDGPRMLPASAVRHLQEYFVYGVPKDDEDWDNTIRALNNDEAGGEADYFHKYGGKALLRTWRQLTGEGRAKRKQGTAKPAVDPVDQLDRYCEVEGIRPAPKPAEVSAPVAPASRPAARVGAEVVRPRRWRTFKALKMVALLSVVSFVMTAAAYYYVDPNLRSYHTLINHGERDALEILRSQIKGGSSGDWSWYYLAFAEYKNGNYDDASQKAFELINNSKTELLTGDCFYLLGAIHTKRGESNIAQAFYDKSLSFYDPEKHKTRFLMANLGMANSLLLQNPVLARKAILKIAPNVPALKNGELKSAFFSRLTKLNYFSGEYNQAITSAKDGLETSVSEEREAEFCIELGFLYGLSGDPDASILYSDRASAILKNYDDPSKTINLTLNEVVSRRLLKIDAQMKEKEIDDWLAKHPDPFLQKKVDIAASIQEGIN